jgi:hypothetical protein
MSRVGILILSIVVPWLGLGDGPVFAANKKKPEVQKFCPVFTDRIVGPNSRSLRYRGILVFFSSDLAAQKWMRDPVSYLDKSLLPQLGDLILTERLIPQRYCPVHPKWKVSVKDPSVIHEEKRVFLFDKEAVRIWNSNPAKFFDPKILPQFPPEMPPTETKAVPSP